FSPALRNLLLSASVASCAGLGLSRAARADEGMWPYNHLPKAELQRKYGFDVSDAWLAHVRKSSVRVSGCSGSFVSGNGLTLTNHHCAEECLSRLSSSDHDLIRQGFYARTQAKELVCPGYAINQLNEIKDVTARVQQATQGLDGEAFHRAFKAESARIEKECATSDDLSCEVVSLYHGGLYELYQYRRYRDVRLVFAPEFDMAFFGGDPDNFNFPRYDLDLTFMRAYADGKPATTPDFLAFTKTPLQFNDLTFVSGNPGSTQRQRTVAELEYLRDHELVDTLISLAQYRGFLNEYAQRGTEARRVSTSELFGVENAYKALHGEHSALLDRAFFQRLVQREGRLRASVKANPELARKYAGAWEAIAQAEDQMAARALELRWIEGQGRPSWARTDLFTWARLLVRGAAERPKKNEERLEEFSDARLPALTQRLLAQKPLNVAFETAKLSFGLTGLREALGADHPFVKKVLGKASPEELATELVKGTALGRVEERKRLWEGGQAAITASKDPMIQLALRIDEDGRAQRSHYENEIESVLTKNSELVARARFEVDGMNSYPDATFSPRLSFGTVRGWREPSTGKWIPAFTTIGGAFERATGRAPFALPKSWIDKQKELALDTPFNFVTDNDIVGGNSGSPVINRQGEFVGLIFDGNIHSLGGKYGFNPADNRAVAVDARAIVEALERIYGATRINAELAGKDK
ncbi:MAG TPA: S46 family peptidase, partial [Polyangiaceae bacterium]|nr:S46 family peptidase [Polyangiaceae bacterium]